MSTTFFNLSPTTARTHPSRAPRLPAPAAVYIGTMPGCDHLPAVELFNLLVPAGPHPIGSTVSRTTLGKYGFQVPQTVAHHRSDAGRASLAGLRTLQMA